MASYISKLLQTNSDDINDNNLEILNNMKERKLSMTNQKDIHYEYNNDDYVPQNIMIKLKNNHNIMNKPNLILPSINLINNGYNSNNSNSNTTKNINSDIHNTEYFNTICTTNEDIGIMRLTRSTQNIPKIKDFDPSDLNIRKKAKQANSLLIKDKKKLWNQHLNNSRDVSFVLDKSNHQKKPKYTRDSLEIANMTNNIIKTPTSFSLSGRESSRRLNGEKKLRDCIMKSDSTKEIQSTEFTNVNLNSIENKLSPKPNTNSLSNFIKYEIGNQLNAGTPTNSQEQPNLSNSKMMVDPGLLYETMDIAAFIQAKNSLYKIFKTNSSKNILNKRGLLVPSGRKDVEALKETLYNKLNNLQKEKSLNRREFFDDLEKIFSTCLDEIIRQVTVHCAERGQLLQQILGAYMEFIEKSIISTINMQKNIEKKYNDEISDLKQNYHHDLNKYIKSLEEVNNIKIDLEEKLIKVKGENSHLNKSIQKFEIECGKLIKKIEDLKTYQTSCLNEIRILKDVIEENGIVLGRDGEIISNSMSRSKMIKKSGVTNSQYNIEHNIASTNGNNQEKMPDNNKENKSVNVNDHNNNNFGPRAVLKHAKSIYAIMDENPITLMDDEPDQKGSLEDIEEMGKVEKVHEDMGVDRLIDDIKWSLNNKGTQTNETCLPGYRFKKAEEGHLLEEYKKSDIIRIDESKNEIIIIKKHKNSNDYEFPKQFTNIIKVHPDDMKNLPNILDYKGNNTHNHNNTNNGDNNDIPKKYYKTIVGKKNLSMNTLYKSQRIRNNEIDKRQ